MLPSESKSVTIREFFQKLTDAYCNPGKYPGGICLRSALVMADAHLLEQVAMNVPHQEAFVAATCVYARLGVRIARQIAHHDAIGMVMELRIVAPKLFSFRTP
jgi:hypothetical protein